jgi:hypothetical protein
VDHRARVGAIAILGTAAGLVVLAGGCALARSSARRPELEPELATSMGELQHHAHKLDLSIQAENAALARFYLHEVEEVAERIEHAFPHHDGHAVAELARTILEPELVRLRAALDRPSWDEARSGLSGLIAGCNRCHAATGHGFIRIQAATANPFNQSFAR